MTDSMIIEKAEEINPRTRALLLCVRSALLQMVGAIEIYLEIPRSKEPTHRK